MTLCRCGHILAHHSWDGRTQSMSCEKCKCQEYDHVPGAAATSVNPPKVIPATFKIAGQPVEGEIRIRNKPRADSKVNETNTETKHEVQTPEVDIKELEKVKADRAKPHVCGTCGSTTTAKRMSGAERWHATGPNTVICHKCYEKARKASPPS